MLTFAVLALVAANVWGVIEARLARRMMATQIDDAFEDSCCDCMCACAVDCSNCSCECDEWNA